MTRLFVVGSDRFAVQAMRLALEYSSGVTVLCIIDGNVGVRQAVRDFAPDVVVVDGMGRPSRGLTHVREIRQETPDAMVLLLSATLSRDALTEVLDAGALVCLARALPLSDAGASAQQPAAADGHVGIPRLSAVVGGQADGNGDGRDPGPVDRRAAADAHASHHGGDAVEAGETRHLARIPNGPAPTPARSPALGDPACALTRREFEILRAAAEGHTNPRISRDQWVTEHTVRFHLSRIYRKLGVTNRAEATRYALVNGLFESTEARARNRLEAADMSARTARRRT